MNGGLTLFMSLTMVSQKNSFDFFHKKEILFCFFAFSLLVLLLSIV